MEVDAVEPETGAGKKEYTEEEWTNYIDTLTAQSRKSITWAQEKVGKEEKENAETVARAKAAKAKTRRVKAKEEKGRRPELVIIAKSPGI